MPFPSSGMRAWGRCLKLPLDAALEAFKGAQELHLETSAQGCLCSCPRIHTDQEGSALGLWGNLELSQFLLPSCQGTDLAQAHGVLSLSPSPIPALRAQQTPTSPPGQSKFQPPPRGCFPHQVFSKFPIPRSWKDSQEEAVPIRESQAWALLALPGVTGHTCPPWRHALEMFPSPCRCEFRSSES